MMTMRLEFVDLPCCACCITTRKQTNYIFECGVFSDRRYTPSVTRKRGNTSEIDLLKVESSQDETKYFLKIYFGFRAVTH